jgi:2-polyprenyl-3-methyl-5-hydroxy-6-metoxy-1,4-benzoquinol methylase
MTAEGTRPCPVCGGLETREIPALGLVPGDPAFRIVRCRTCNYGWTDPSLPEHEIVRWYPQAYYGDKNVRFNVFFEALVRIFRRRRARVIERLAPKGPVLDVGCGRGLILSSLREIGFEVHGTELSDTAAFHARERGIPVHTGDFLTSPHTAGTFRAVIFWHSLEHFRDPFAAIERARDLLLPGGLLVIAVPNSDSLQARASGSSWFHLDVPRHYVHFGTRSLRRALEARGFTVRTVSHFALEQNPYGWLQSLYNLCGFDWNLLYDLLKSRSARRALDARRAAQAFVVALLLPLFLTVAFTLWAVELVLRRGGTIDVYATRS